MVRNIVYYIHMFCISRSGHKKKVSDYCEDCACPGFPHALKQTAVRRLNMISFLFCFFMDLDVSIQCTLSHLEQ